MGIKGQRHFSAAREDVITANLKTRRHVQRPVWSMDQATFYSTATSRPGERGLYPEFVRYNEGDAHQMDPVNFLAPASPCATAAKPLTPDKTAIHTAGVWRFRCRLRRSPAIGRSSPERSFSTRQIAPASSADTMRVLQFCFPSWQQGQAGVQKCRERHFTRRDAASRLASRAMQFVRGDKRTEDRLAAAQDSERDGRFASRCRRRHGTKTK